jgi:hypothetical protein
MKVGTAPCGRRPERITSRTDKPDTIKNLLHGKTKRNLIKLSEKHQGLHNFTQFTIN